MNQLQRITDCRCKLAENPLWHPLEKQLYWLDIPEGQVYRYDPRNHACEMVHKGKPIGGMVIQADGSLLLFSVEGLIQKWHQGKLTTISKRTFELRGFRFNDAIADARGRVLSGTIGMRNSSAKNHSAITGVIKRIRIQRQIKAQEQQGCLYRLGLDGELSRLIEGLGRPNGMGFSRNGRHLYLTDSLHKVIYICDYDQGSGTLANRQVFVQVPKGEGAPDGLAVDAAGHIWSARNRGGCLVRYTPNGIERDRVPLPVNKVTSLTFGGQNYTDIYVTTAGEQGQASGAVYRLHLGIAGIPEYPARISI